MIHRHSLLATLFFVALTGSAHSQGTYEAKVATPLIRSEVVLVAIGNKLYEIGGEAGDVKDSPLLQEYDAATGKWRDLAPMPAGASHLGVAVLNGKIYVAGGFTMNVHLKPVDRFFVYDPKADHWQALPPISAPLGSVGLAAIAGKIHAIGGRGEDQIVVATHQVYDPAANKWTNAAPLPVARDHFGIAVIGGRIHVVGGRGSGTGFGVNVAEHNVFDPATGVWTQAAPMPTARSGGAATVYRGLIFYLGGECKDQKTRTAFDENEAYDMKTNNWTKFNSLRTGQHAFGAASAGEYLYYIGGTQGCGGGPPAKDVMAFQLP